MSFAALHKSIVFSIAGLGLFALTLGGELPAATVVLCAVGFVASWFCVGPRIADPRWAQGWTVALLALVALELVRAWLGEPPLALALEVSAALGISRLANRRSAAEHQQVILLAFLHLCAATVLSSEVTWAIPFLGFVLVVPGALALTHLRGEIEAHFRADGDPSREGALVRVLASRRVVGGRFLAGIAALSFPIFAGTALLFLLFPRVGFGLLAFGRDDDSALVGYDDEIELGRVGTLRADTRVVMRVTPPESVGRPHGALRMRGTSFDHYDGTRWSRTLPGSPRALRQLRDTFVITRVPGDDDLLWDVILDHFDPTVIFLLPGAVAVEIPARVRGGIETERALSLSPGIDLRYDDDEGIGLHYGVWTPGDGVRELSAGLTTVERDAYLELPPGHEALAALATEWTEGATTDRQRAERIVAALRTRFTYSVEMRDPGDRPPVLAFLFDHHTGHCEYFSSAAVLLLRSIGVPARNVNGFLGGRWNTFGGYAAIMQGDAHTWAEVFLPGEGWVTFEPTPSARADAIAEDDWTAAIAAAFDALQAAWQETIVEWDLGAQRTLLRRVARFFRNPSGGSTAAETPVAVTGDTPATSVEVYLAIAVLVLAVAVFVAWRRRRRTQPGAELPPEVRDVIAIYRRLERALAARGLARAPSTTPLEHVGALEAQGFAGAADVRAVTERYLAVRFGGASITAEERVALRARAEAAARAPDAQHAA